MNTTKVSNVKYYQNFGITALKEFEIENKGVTNWLMLRVQKN